MNGIYNRGLVKCSECGRVYENLRRKFSPCCDARMRSKPRGATKYKAKKIGQMDSRALLIVEVRKR